jgi:hypothetical protein
MRRLTYILFALIAGSFAMQLNAAPDKVPNRSDIYDHVPTGFSQLGNSSIYYSINRRLAEGPGYQYGISLLGEIDNMYYSTTDQLEDESERAEDRPGAGFIAAFQVNGGTADYLDALNGTTIDNVRMTARLEPLGDVAALIVYTLTNNNDQDVTINAGVWGDIMIGDNDEAPLERMLSYFGNTYGIKMRYGNLEDTPAMCALFGEDEDLIRVTPADDYWFGFFSSNWHPNEICGEYSNYVYDTNTSWSQNYSEYYNFENGCYDSGLGFCWKYRVIPAHESIELSYIICVGEFDPVGPNPPDGYFIYDVEAYDMADWNNYSQPHMAHIWGEYLHPFGRNGYIEYQVDNETSWTRIPTALITGDPNGFSLEFPMYFDESVTTTHELRLRFIDDMGYDSPLTGMTWIDVRSYPVGPYLTSYEYDGSPVSFVVDVNGEPVTIGGNDEYINEGIYNVVVAEGACADNTIGVLTITFSIENSTAIDEIATVNEENGAWYTIDGRRITAPSQPGIYISNGKKYIVK